jgi:hypothetical protein
MLENNQAAVLLCCCLMIGSRTAAFLPPSILFISLAFPVAHILLHANLL